ncbi:MAG: transglutaminase-like domain-containing protein [Acidimicrobiales bacterium]
MAALEALDYRGGNRASVRATIPMLAGRPAQVALRIAVSREPDLHVARDELRADGEPVETFLEPDGSSIAWFHTDGSPLTVTYEATVDLGSRRGPEKLTPAEFLRFTSPSRYCPSDAMSGFASSMFGPVAPVVVEAAGEADDTPADAPADEAAGAAAGDVIDQVAQWVNGHLSYEFGASTGTTTAADTLMSAAGVCRDFTHLTICLLRGLDIPARYVAAYAPGLEPPDFHALVEAHDGTRWRLFDATGLSDPTFAVRIATGVDSAEVPFMTVLAGDAPVGDMQVSAQLDG